MRGDIWAYSRVDAICADEKIGCRSGAILESNCDIFLCLFNNAFTFLRVVDRDALVFKLVDQLISNNGSMNPQGREVVVLLAAVQELSEYFSCPIVEAELIIVETLCSNALVDAYVVEDTESVGCQGDVVPFEAECKGWSLE